jgi:uncharacterized protein YndB with AHSA1/START domain
MAEKASAGASSVEISDDGPMIVAMVRLPGCSPQQAMSAFTAPAVLARWWRGELTAHLVPGGEYSVGFPAIPARLTGRVLGYEPGKSLAFGWAWDGDDSPPSSVQVTAQPDDDGGAVLTIRHGPHEEDEPGRTARQEHLEGWEYFLPGLPAAVLG